MIALYVHRCVVREGPAEGNKVATSVSSHDLECRCEHCGEPLATTEQIIAHVYEELTNDHA